MRLSVTIHALCGAVAVSGLALPGSLFGRQLVDLAKFGKFQTISLEQAKADMVENNAKASSANTTSPSSAASPATDNTAGNVNAAAAGTCTTPSTRVEWLGLSDADRKTFLQAVKCLMGQPATGNFASAGSTSLYEDLVAVHMQMTDTIHGVAQFLPWHRYYVHIFESLLRDKCAYTGPMTWWSEPANAGNFANAPLFTSDYFGAAPLASNGQGSCINDGVFGGTQLHVGGNGCLARAVDESATSQCSSGFVDTCNQNTVYSGMESCSENGPHGYGHNGIGAVMAGVPTSPNDPVFFMHHGWVDRNWVAWQNLDIPNRLYQVNGCQDKPDANGNCATQLTTSYTLTSQGLYPDVTVNDVMDTQGGYLCYIYDQ